MLRLKWGVRERGLKVIKKKKKKRPSAISKSLAVIHFQVKSQLPRSGTLCGLHPGRPELLRVCER